MNRLLFCEPWPVSSFHYLLDQFLDGIISLFITPAFYRSFLPRAFLPEPSSRRVLPPLWRAAFWAAPSSLRAAAYRHRRCPPGLRPPFPSSRGGRPSACC